MEDQEGNVTVTFRLMLGNIKLMVKVKNAKLSLDFIKHHTMKTYGIVEV
jgi:hypothetical protein